MSFDSILPPRPARLASRLCAALAALLFAGAATAQTFPDRPIRMVVPFPAGGGADFVARP